MFIEILKVGHGGSAVRARDWQSSGRVFAIHWRRFDILPISFTPLCHCLSEETLKAVGVDVRGKWVTCRGLHNNYSTWSIMSTWRWSKLCKRKERKVLVLYTVSPYPERDLNALYCSLQPLSCIRRCPGGNIGETPQRQHAVINPSRHDVADYYAPQIPAAPWLRHLSLAGSVSRPAEHPSARSTETPLVLPRQPGEEHHWPTWIFSPIAEPFFFPRMTVLMFQSIADRKRKADRINLSSPSFLSFIATCPIFLLRDRWLS